MFIISSQIAIKPFPGLRMLMEEDTSHNKNLKKWGITTDQIAVELTFKLNDKFSILICSQGQC